MHRVRGGSGAFIDGEKVGSNGDPGLVQCQRNLVCVWQIHWSTNLTTGHKISTLKNCEINKYRLHNMMRERAK
jgi:hypothetical protein